MQRRTNVHRRRCALTATRREGRHRMSCMLMEVPASDRQKPTVVCGSGCKGATNATLTAVGELCEIPRHHRSLRRAACPGGSRTAHLDCSRPRFRPRTAVAGIRRTRRGPRPRARAEGTSTHRVVCHLASSRCKSPRRSVKGGFTVPYSANLPITVPWHHRECVTGSEQAAV